MNRVTWFAAEWWRKQRVNSAMTSQGNYNALNILDFPWKQRNDIDSEDQSAFTIISGNGRFSRSSDFRDSI